MLKGAHTVIDANLNRALEGIRVCEDIFRFSMQNSISSEFKDMRHTLLSAVQEIFGNSLAVSRNVTLDSQKFVDTESEKKRTGYEDLFSANIRRACEAVRVMEEFFKAVPSDSGNPFQNIRFNLYELEQRGFAIISKKDILDKFDYSLYGILDTAFVDPGIMVKSAEIMAGEGCRIIQLRMKNSASGEFLETAEAVSNICSRTGAVFIVNDRPDIALLSNASGLHLGQDDLSPDRACEILRNNMITGISTHTLIEAEEASGTPADYIAIGPVFDTSSKAGELLSGIGTDVLKQVSSIPGKPVVAIGGISKDNIAQVLDAGCRCAAVISALYLNGDLKGNVRNLVHLIESAKG